MLAVTALRLEVTIETQAVTGSLPSGPCIGRSVHWTVRALLSNADRAPVSGLALRSGHCRSERTRRRPTPVSPQFNRLNFLPRASRGGGGGGGGGFFAPESPRLSAHARARRPLSSTPGAQLRPLQKCKRLNVLCCPFSETTPRRARCHPTHPLLPLLLPPWP